MPAKSTAIEELFNRPLSGILGISGSRGVAKNRGSFGNPRIGSARGCGLGRAQKRSPTFGGAFCQENTPAIENIGQRGSCDPLSPGTPCAEIAHVVGVQDRDTMTMSPVSSKGSPTFSGGNNPATGSVGQRGSCVSVSPRTPLADIPHVLGAFQSRGREVMNTMTPARPQAEEEDSCMVISPNPNSGLKFHTPHLPKGLLGSEFLTPRRNLLISIDTVENQVLEELRKLKQKRGKGKKRVRDVCFKRSLRMAFEDCAESREADYRRLKHMIASLQKLGLL